MVTRFSLALTLLVTSATIAAAPASAQIRGGVGGVVNQTVGQVSGAAEQTAGDLGRSVGDIASPAGAGGGGPLFTGPNGQPVSLENAVGPVGRTLASVANITPYTLNPRGLLEIRDLRLKNLIAANKATLDRDERGQPVLRSNLVAIDPTAAQLNAALAMGFRIVGNQNETALGLRLVTLAVPARRNVRKALAELRRGAPGIVADFDHVYEPAGGALAPSSVALAAAAATAVRPGVRIAMIDGGVAAHPSLARAAIEQRGFAGAAAPTGHGTAVASLLVGDQGAFRGAARGAALFVGDIYGGNPAAGSASAIVRALDWAASKRPSLVTMSLVGPPNQILATSVAALQRRGIIVVAAVGNDGPSAPASYPASYPGVVAVTGVDARGKALLEAGRSAHLDFAAPGADLAAATPGQGYARVRGTSFAAPFAAARLAAHGSLAGLASEAVPGKGKVGRGIVCAACAIAPKAIGLK